MLMLSARRAANHLATCFALVAGAIGCGGDEAPPMAPLEVPPSDAGRPLPLDATILEPVGSSCVEAEMKRCVVKLPSQGTIHPCFVGVQICTDGKWSRCIEPPDAGTVEGGSAVN
jgi:hypothetical protein